MVKGKKPAAAASEIDYLTLFRDEINAKYKGALKFGNDPDLAPVTMTTGIPPLDFILEGGIQLGQMTLITGEYSNGKSTLCLLACKQAIDAGQIAVFIDAERSYNPDWAEKLGVDTSKLLVSQPPTGEAAFDIARAMINQAQVIVIDSLIALVPAKEFEKEQETPGDQARLIGRGIRSFLPLMTQKKTAILMTNQLRLSIGVMFGNPEFIPGGRAQRFYSYQHIRCRRGAWIEEAALDSNGNQIKVGSKIKMRKLGFHMRFIAEKSKAGEPFRECEVPFTFDGVFDTEAAVFDTAIELGFIVKTGANYTIPGVTTEKFYGAKKMKAWFGANVEAFESLRRRVFSEGRVLGDGVVETGATEDEEDVSFD